MENRTNPQCWNRLLELSVEMVWFVAKASLRLPSMQFADKAAFGKHNESCKRATRFSELTSGKLKWEKLKNRFYHEKRMKSVGHGQRG